MNGYVDDLIKDFERQRQELVMQHGEDDSFVVCIDTVVIPTKHFESCAENIQERVGCISQRDFDILGVNFDCKNGGFQRKGCLCVAGKTELLSNKKRCPSGCVYCYWH